MQMKVYGNTSLVAALEQMAESGRIPHAILMHEDDGGGALPIAINFLERVYGGNPRVERLIHPDVHFVFPVVGEKEPVSSQFAAEWRDLLLSNPYFTEAEMYSALGFEKKQGIINVKEARTLLSKLSLSAVEGGYRSVVMYLPEKMNPQAANALLKMVEEPPEKTLFLLITHAPERVLTTIFSRCLFMRVQPLDREVRRELHHSDAESAVQKLMDALLDALVKKNLSAALELGEVFASLESRDVQKDFLQLASECFRSLFLIRQGLGELADVPSEKKAGYETAASALKPTFPRAGMAALDRAMLLLERNVNQKILFSDLVARLYTKA